MKQKDSLGRATFHCIAPLPDVRPTPREIRWFKHIERHGPQNSDYLFELTRGTHRCKDTALRQLQKLRAGGYLCLPPQQRVIERAEFQPYIYDLARKAKDHLAGIGVAEPSVRPTGPWWHSYLVSCVTGSIDIAAARAGVRYIPAQDILDIREATLALPFGRQRLIPDQIFALDYGGRYRAYTLEVDRGTEPITSAGVRKSLAAMVQQYRIMLAADLPARHYGLKATLLCLFAFQSSGRETLFRHLAEREADRYGDRFLTAVIPPGWKPLAVLAEGPWQRPRRAPVSLLR
ncbi:replication-relaxation family protein [Albidovulum sediminis]|uniref:Replication-relaxation family protein n=1 Tax=Albidovulum sediminis TaxID=3066345 RepID=A0ABT2NG94_9RHOB|nr:replication-relaxation family protein [Defluviimonas sediminis]MCT8327936.1 replication-relaxation family protein [Defluviimonas sediminis]